MRLPDLARELSADCPNARAELVQRCQVYFPDLSKLAG
jgi:hypothetical protein